MTQTQSTDSFTGGRLFGERRKSDVAGILGILVILFVYVACPPVSAQEADSIEVSLDTLRLDYLSPSIDSLVVDSLSMDTLNVDSLPLPQERKPVMALRTNLLYDAALIANIGGEVALGKGFTLGFDWFYTWLYSNKQHVYWQGYGGYLTARYYFGQLAAKLPYSGHHVGIYGTALTYDIEFGGKGYQAAKFGFGGGIEYGYSLPVAHNLCIDFNLGVGYQGGEYKTYLPTDDGTGHYVWQATYMRHWWGPTKAEISLKWIIDAPVKKKTPAGEQIETPTEEESLPEAEGAEELAKKKGGEQ